MQVNSDWREFIKSAKETDAEVHHLGYANYITVVREIINGALASARLPVVCLLVCIASQRLTVGLQSYFVPCFLADGRVVETEAA
jgi:hypothetical protein